MLKYSIAMKEHSTAAAGPPAEVGEGYALRWAEHGAAVRGRLPPHHREICRTRADLVH